jgi:transposase
MSTIAQIETTRVVVGVDTHRDSHTAVALDGIGRKLDYLTIDTNSSGYRQLMKWASGWGEVVGYAVEGTGSYGAGVARYLVANGQRVIEIDRPNRKARRLKGKSDVLDAEQAARQVLAGVATAKPKSHDATAEMLRTLKVARNTALKSSTQAKNSLGALVITAPDQIRQQLRSMSPAKLIRTCAGFRPGPCDGVEAATKIALRSLARRVQALQVEIAELAAEIARLTGQAAPELLELFGVGSEVASTLLVTAGDNVDRLVSEPAFASLCGVAPVPASSGQTNRHRLSRAGDRQANAALHRVVIVRLRWHEESKHYLERRTAEGKSKKETVRCLKRYVAREVYGALKAMERRRAGVPERVL